MFPSQMKIKQFILNRRFIGRVFLNQSNWQNGIFETLIYAGTALDVYFNHKVSGCTNWCLRLGLVTSQKQIQINPGNFARFGFQEENIQMVTGDISKINIESQDRYGNK